VSGTALFRASALGSLTFHALLLLSTDGLQGGGDMKPHLRLIQLMGEQVALYNVYPPLYHALGALTAPALGLATFPEWFAWCSAACLIAGFRFFQRAAQLPDASSALFAWAPYGFALSWCLPKIEVAGYAIALFALGFATRRRYAALAAALAAAFFVHTGAALFLGLAAGTLAMAQRDARALIALAAGSLTGAALPLAHVAAGCSAAQALLFSEGDYLRPAPWRHNLLQWDRILVLANPIALVAAVAGAPLLWRRHRPTAVLCIAISALYANEIWLAPFGARTTLDLLRGLTIFALPVAASAGVFLAPRPGAALIAVAGSAALAVLAAWLVVPEACVSKPIDVATIERLDVDRCSFRWRVRSVRPRGERSRGPAANEAAPGAASGRGAERAEIGADRVVEGTAAGEGAPQ
jgi:hypothetical protein